MDCRLFAKLKDHLQVFIVENMLHFIEGGEKYEKSYENNKNLKMFGKLIYPYVSSVAPVDDKEVVLIQGTFPKSDVGNKQFQHLGILTPFDVSQSARTQGTWPHRP